MNTPIRDFAVKYAEDNGVRLHMPGHKGVGSLGVEKYDITEIEGADVLYGAKGIIRESENNASSLFSSYRTFYSVEGSSLCIKAMLGLIALYRRNNSRKTLILAARNVHKAFIYGCAIADIDVEWMYSSEDSNFCSCVIDADTLHNKLGSMDILPDAVYVTTPDYLGRTTDVKSLAEVCDKYSIPLIVDNAHGAYLAFLDESLHPINNGAYICCDSAHKTLPVLTGGAYLHLSHKAEKYAKAAEGMMSVMGSTSPSYLIMQSLDMCNRYLDENYRDNLRSAIKKINLLKSDLKAKGLCVTDGEPLKIVVDLEKSGISAAKVRKALKESGIEPEMCDESSLVLMFTCENPESDYTRVHEALSSVECDIRGDTKKTPTAFETGVKIKSIREAVFSEYETVNVAASAGRICAVPTVSCPPAIPIVVSGEFITEEAVSLMKYYGIEKIDVMI